jgi:hypothetical protein
MFAGLGTKKKAYHEVKAIAVKPRASPVVMKQKTSPRNYQSIELPKQI